MQMLPNHPSLFACFSLLLLFAACNPPQATEKAPEIDLRKNPPLFQKLDPAATGIQFQNGVQDNNNLNVITFNYLYNGGALGVGDFNNDGLDDLYFVSTLGKNKLYLNKGGMKFEDITATAGVAAEKGVKMGVTVADVNADGYLDIYLCRTGATTADRANLLFINNQNLTFTESAQAYGLASTSPSNQANFFDYDLDGDLDMYLLNHPENFNTTSQMRLEEVNGKPIRSTTPEQPFESDQLFRNNGNNTFTDVSTAAGIVNRAFGLSCTVSDINRDGYPDIYVGNDFIEPDFFYLNNKNGTFTNKINDYFRHTSQFTMGTDFADLNNDGRQDLLAMDMLPEANARRKSLATTMMSDRYNTLLKYGYGHQIMRNMLQLNNGRDFSDIGVMAGISATDWTWGPLAMDYDNDGWKDIFMSNGILREFTNNDYINFTLDSVMKAGGQFKGDINGLIEKIPSVPVHNYLYRNRGDLTFEDVSVAWGFGDKTFSNGGVFADLDGDGDLELIVNNLREPAGIYDNQARQRAANNYLQVTFSGSPANPFAIGAAARITLADGSMQYQELTPSRGFFASQAYLVHFGLGQRQQVQTLEVAWPDGKIQTLNNPTINQRITVRYADAQKGKWQEAPAPSPLFAELQPAQLGINFTHQENVFLDYDREFLLPHNLSTQGPCLVSGDVNGDGLDDFYVGGATGQPGALFVQTPTGTFRPAAAATWAADQNYEDTGATFFDADGDQDLDLYVVSGGNVNSPGTDLYQSRLYLNDGSGNFLKSNQSLPKNRDSGACVTAFDYDQDGDADLFIGGRVVAGAYPTAPLSYVLQNNQGAFTDVTAQVAPGLHQYGMLTAIQFADLNGNGTAEMIVTGEWLPVTVFAYRNGQYQDATAAFGLNQTNGWWNSLLVKDMDNDGDLDLVAGNLGLNTRLQATVAEPLRLFVRDFDDNGSLDPILTHYENGKQYPWAQKDLLLKQLPGLKKTFIRYATYATATIEDLFPAALLRQSKTYEAKTLRSTYFENTGNGRFTAQPLPAEAQTAPVNCMVAGDFNADGHQDLLFAGNDYGMEVETARCDAFNGLLLTGDGKGHFTPQENRNTGFWATREVRGLQLLKTASNEPLVVVANNNAPIQVFRKKD